MKFFPLLGLCAALGVNAQPNLPDQASDRAKQVIAYWTTGRRRAAKPLDRVLEESADGSRQLMLRTGTNTKSTHRHLQTTVADGDWNAGGKINEAAGRLFFTINGSNYVCSASVVNDYGTAGRSLLATAAHCVYDESIDRFASNYLFIPKQDDGGTDASNRVCSDDYYGCWVPTHAVIDSRWATGTWSSNIPYDYALLVVPDSGAWTSGSNNLDNQVLDNAVPPVEVDFTNEQGLVSGSWVQFHGYSYNQDPNFRYCRVQANSQTDRWLVPGCMLSGGASGGPCQPNNDGNGKLYSVVSFSSSSGGVQTGMGGARLNSNSFSCLYETAKTTTGNTIYSYGGTPCPITSNVPPASGLDPALAPEKKLVMKQATSVYSVCLILIVTMVSFAMASKLALMEFVGVDPILAATDKLVMKQMIHVSLRLQSVLHEAVLALAERARHVQKPVAFGVEVAVDASVLWWVDARAHSE
ncbi:hypothetical protein ACA910_015884 [Epithemia clementina (nom. ined.)]